jgi:hypothetical protein
MKSRNFKIKESALRILRAHMLAAAQEEQIDLPPSTTAKFVRWITATDPNLQFSRESPKIVRVNFKANNLDAVLSTADDDVIAALASRQGDETLPRETIINFRRDLPQDSKKKEGILLGRKGIPREVDALILLEHLLDCTRGEVQLKTHPALTSKNS